LIEIDAKAKEKGLTINHQASNIPKMFADENKVHQILLNLIGNSLKFTPSGGTITISYQSDGQNISVSVKDSGIGISTDDLNRLFKKFSRLDNSYVAPTYSEGNRFTWPKNKEILEKHLTKKQLFILKGKGLVLKN
jgi:signal transduction histidine kinase